MGIRAEVAAVLKRPISNVASFTQILGDTSRDTGNTQRVMRDLIAIILTNLEEMEVPPSVLSSPSTWQETTTKYAKPKPKIPTL